MFSAVKNYFAEFAVLKNASKEFWLANGIQFFDGLAYFSMMNVITLYLTTNCGFNDVDSGAWVGIFTLYVTAFVFAVGSVCDTIGIKKSFLIGITLLLIARLSFGVAPMFLTGEILQYTVMGMILLMSLGTAFMSPVTSTAIRRFTSLKTRATGFNIYYLIMNVGAIFSGFAVTDGLRHSLGEVNGNLAIMIFGFVMSACCVVCASAMNENNYAEESERIVDDGKPKPRPLAIFMEVWKEPAFQKLVLFLLLTIGVRLVFTHQFLVMPKYYTRVLTSDFDLGLANSINPIIIVFGLILLIPIINRFNTFKLIVVGMSISAMSLLFMAMPVQWFLSIPGIHNLQDAYMFAIFAQILVFAFGELIFSPRFTEYIANVAPKEKVASYMSLSALPMFIAKPINGFVSGMLVARYSYDGIRAKIETGNVNYDQSPEFMWLIYFGLALLSPLAVLAMKNVLEGKKSSESENSNNVESAPVEEMA
ncbi:MAG: MFS transporter [Oligoflexia bacterium]|nr:MFS transporter [Oligoflexia bacterium]MBF0366567.1 MFS transporter [Oligoflexia bacterium]